MGFHHPTVPVQLTPWFPGNFFPYCKRRKQQPKRKGDGKSRKKGFQNSQLQQFEE
jgi:hypothetical protein